MWWLWMIAVVAALDAGGLAQQRVAHARARTELVDRVFTLPRDTRQTIGDWARQDPLRERNLRTWLHSLPRFGDVRRDYAGGVSVDLVLLPQQIAAQCELPETWSARNELVWATGHAAPGSKPKLSDAGWEAVSVVDAQCAVEAATAVAVHELVERLQSAPIGPGESLGAVLTQSEARGLFRSAVFSQAEVTTAHTPAQLVKARASLTMSGLVSAIRKALDDPQRDLRHLQLQDLSSRLQAVGYAAPPRPSTLPSGLEANSAPRVLRVSVDVPEQGDMTERLLACRKAAAPLLLEKVLRLQDEESHTLATRCEENPDLHAVLEVVTQGGRIAQPPVAGQKAQVDLSLASIWEAVEQVKTP